MKTLRNLQFFLLYESLVIDFLILVWGFSQGISILYIHICFHLVLPGLQKAGAIMEFRVRWRLALGTT